MKRIVVIAFSLVAFALFGAYPTASQYEYVDVSQIPVDGTPYPARVALGGGNRYVLKAEDVACIAEITCERDRWLNCTNAVLASLLEPRPTRALTTNLLANVAGWLATEGNTLDSYEDWDGDSLRRRFLPLGWTDGLTPQGSAFYTGIGKEGYFSFVTIGLPLLHDYLSPAAVTPANVGFAAHPQAQPIANMYANADAKRRIFGGLCIGYGNDYWGGIPDTTKWSDWWMGFLFADNVVSHYYTYQSLNDDYDTKLTTRTLDYYRYDMGRNVRATSSTSSKPTGAISPWGWTTSDTPYIALNPVYYGRVSSATFYGIVSATTYESWESGGNTVYSCKLCVIRLPLTKLGTKTVDGQLCETWQLPSSMNDSRTLLNDLIHNQLGGSDSTGGGFPVLATADLHTGLLDLTLNSTWGD